VLAVGVLVLAVVILGSLTGAIKTAVYDGSAGSPRVHAVGSPLSYTASIDANAKHIRDGTAAYLGHLDRIDASSGYIRSLASSTDTMRTSVAALRLGLARVLLESRGIDTGLRHLSRTAGTAGGSLSGVAASSSDIAALMALLRSATASLGGAVRAIDATAAGIAGTQLPAALAATRAIDALLPSGVPPVRHEAAR
jgi:hypothetical protein